jgi:uncharacterized alkaline shock family protein YloU
MQETKLGTVRIAPSVIANIVSLTASAIEGVADMSTISRPPSRVIGRTNTGTAPGVTLNIRNDTITADVYIIAQPEANLRRLGQTLQRKIREALDQMVGIPAEQINVYIEDVTE